MGKKSQKSAKKFHKNAQSISMDSVHSSIFSVFARDGSLDEAFLEAGQSPD